MQTQKEREIENKLASTSFWQLLMLAAALVIWAAAITGLLNREQTAARGWHSRMIKISNLSNQAVTFSTDLPFLLLNCLSHDGSCSSSREGGGGSHVHYYSAIQQIQLHLMLRGRRTASLCSVLCSRLGLHFKKGMRHYQKIHWKLDFNS